MRLLSIASSFPSHQFSQSEVWNILKNASDKFNTLLPRSQGLLEKILLGDSGIAARGFSVSDLPVLFEASPDQLNRWHEQHAASMASSALRQALSKASLEIDDLDAIIICTCTGYLCPGISSYVAEELGAPENVYLQDIVGLGCGAAIPTLRAGDGYLAANPEAKIGVIAVEACSAAFYMDDDPGVLISLCLFGDGCSASIWDGAQAGGYVLSDFQTLHRPEHREKVRFENNAGYLKNKLHRSVPELSSQAVLDLWESRPNPVKGEKILSHGGGKAVVEALREKIPTQDFSEAETVLQKHGNLSSPSVMVALENALENESTLLDNYWLTSFGAGFAAHAAKLVKC